MPSSSWRQDIAKIILFDIEATQLQADAGQMLCMSYQYLGEKKVHTISILDDPNFFRGNKMTDKYVVEEAYKILSEADMIISWYGKRFDVPFINTRLLFYGLSPLPRTPHFDGWEVARKRLKLHSNRLASVSSFLGLEDKTPLKLQVWSWASTGHIPSIKYIVKHCEQDIVVLAQAYERLKAFSTPQIHPNVANIVGLASACPICASSRLERRGYTAAAKKRFIQMQCKSCGHWFKGGELRA